MEKNLSHTLFLPFEQYKSPAVPYFNIFVIWDLSDTLF